LGGEQLGELPPALFKFSGANIWEIINFYNTIVHFSSK
jgi:hypothetical protein